MSDKVKFRKYTGKILVGVLILVVVSGLAQYDFSPRILLKNALIAAKALYKKYGFQYGQIVEEEKYEAYKDLWYKVPHTKSGVLRHEEAAYNGLTFFTNHEARAFLIDMEGNVLHEWAKPFSQVWPRPKHIQVQVRDELIYWRKAKLFPNGDVIAVYEGMNLIPYGGGIVKVDKNSNIIWKVGINAHHDFDIDENGNIYVLKHEYTFRDELKEPIIEDGIAVISPAGTVLKEISFFPIFYGNEKLRDKFSWNQEDPFHANSIEILDAEKATRFPMFEAGDILVSMLRSSLVFVLDGKTFNPKWGFTDLTKYQHDADYLADGTILVFDNMGNSALDVDRGAGVSRIVAIDPSDFSYVWRYDGTPEEPFSSENRGSQVKLPNGNILITESTKGRIFEITDYGKIVWEYISTSLERNSIGVVCWAERFKKAELPFLDMEQGN